MILFYLGIFICTLHCSMSAMFDPEMQVMMQEHNYMKSFASLQAMQVPPFSQTFPQQHSFHQTSIRTTNLGPAPQQQTMETTDHSTVSKRAHNLCCNKYMKKNKCCGCCFNTCAIVCCCPCTTCISTSYVCCNDQCTRNCVGMILDINKD